MRTARQQKLLALLGDGSDVPSMRLLNQGRWANATLFLVGPADHAWVIKDFGGLPWVARATYGLAMVRRELRGLQALQGIRGVPQEVRRLDRYAFCYRFVPGFTLNDPRRPVVGRSFFLELESLVRSMHARGVAHLDIRYRRNILVTPEGLPVLIDFQTSVMLAGKPAFFRDLLIRTDISGVYKQWTKRSPDTIDPERKAFLNRSNKVRRFWILRGYMFTPRRRRPQTTQAPTAPGSP